MRPVSHVVDSQEAPRDIESPRLHKHFARSQAVSGLPGAAFRRFRRCLTCSDAGSAILTYSLLSDLRIGRPDTERIDETRLAQTPKTPIR